MKDPKRGAYQSMLERLAGAIGAHEAITTSVSTHAERHEARLAQRRKDMEHEHAIQRGIAQSNSQV